MKVTVERDALKDALAAVVGHTKGLGKNAMPILTHVMLEAENGCLRLTGHDLASCSTASVPAEVSVEGATCLPGDQFSTLVSGLAKGANVTLAAEERRAKLIAARSSYDFPVLPAVDFPQALELRNGASFKLTSKQAQRLFGAPLVAVSNEGTRQFLCGVYIHRADAIVVGVATDMHKLLRVTVAVDAPQFDGVIVPSEAAAEIVKIANFGDVTVTISNSLISAEVDARRFVSRLIDATYPDYSMAIPQPSASSIMLDAKDLESSLARLSVARSDRGDIVKLSWDGEASQIRAEARSDNGPAGEELVDSCGDGCDAGSIAAQNGYLRKMADALGGENVRLRILNEATAIRMENPADDSILGIVMPCRW